LGKVIEYWPVVPSVMVVSGEDSVAERVTAPDAPMSATICTTHRSPNFCGAKTLRA
jgi:hypothetical protein